MEGSKYCKDKDICTKSYQAGFKYGQQESKEEIERLKKELKKLRDMVISLEYDLNHEKWA